MALESYRTWLRRHLPPRVAELVVPTDVSIEWYRRHRWSQRIAMTALIVLGGVQLVPLYGLVAYWFIPAGLLLYGIIEAIVLGSEWLVSGRFGIAAAAAGAVYGLTPEYVHSTELYKAAAQVVPVLLLAFVLERRQEYFEATQWVERFSVLVTVMALFMAGAVTFVVLADDDASRGDARLVTCPITASAIILILALVRSPARPKRHVIGDE
jgi:hypothetical protein